MALLRLDYHGDARQFPWAGALLLAIALAVAAQVFLYYQELNKTAAYWERMAAANKRGVLPDAAADPRQTEEMALEIKYANGVLNKLALPWDRLFQAVEGSSGKNVALLGVEPDTDKHEVKISAEARDLFAVTQYLQHLSQQEVFSSVYLQSHQVQQQMPEKPVRFTLVAVWKAGP